MSGSAVARTGARAGAAIGSLGIRPIDVGLTGLVIAAVELNVVVGTGPGAVPLDALSYALGAIMPLPILVRRRWPLQVLIACSVLLFVYYSVHRRNISPAPLLALPLYDAAVAGYLTWAIVIPACYMAIGLVVVGASTHQGLLSLAANFMPSVVLLALAIALGEVVRGRRALAAETAQRLRMADEEREAEAARRVAEERLRIARELHDTVAHSMATITVQAGSALHVLGPAETSQNERIRSVLTAIRDTSKSALAEMRTTLGQLRGTPAAGRTLLPRGNGGGGLGRLSALRDAVEAAGVPVSLTVHGDPAPLPGQVDHAAYRILQESLTNVLRHAGPGAKADVDVQYLPDRLILRVSDNGAGAPAATVARPRGGHGIAGMRERAASVGGDLTAGPRDGGGFEVLAELPAGEAADAQSATGKDSEIVPDLSS